MSAERVVIRWASGERDLEGAFRLRDVVFCQEQGVPREEELDSLDDRAHHLVALAPGDGDVIGTLRLLSDGRRAKIGRVAVERAWRRRGIASRMLAAALARARELGCAEARLAAQTDAIVLYERAGFVVQSETFLDAGILHVWMGRSLAPAELPAQPGAARS